MRHVPIFVIHESVHDQLISDLSRHKVYKSSGLCPLSVRLHCHLACELYP